MELIEDWLRIVQRRKFFSGPPIRAWNFLKHDFEKEFFNFCNFFSWVVSKKFFKKFRGQKNGIFLDFF
jgi:hypothetical protein